MNIKNPNRKIKFSASLSMFPILFCIISCNGPRYAFIAIGTAVIHEFGHIIAAKLLKINISSMKLDMLGARINMGSELVSYPREILLCAAGPGANILTVLVCLPFIHSETVAFVAASSAVLATINLMPIHSFDGGRILSSVISSFFGTLVSRRVVDITSAICLSVVWIISSYLLLRVGASLSVFIFCISVFGSVFLARDNEIKPYEVS